MQDFILYSGVQFSDEEKRKSFFTAKRMIDLYNVVRSRGILSLESEVVNDTAFIKMGVNLVIEGLPPEEIEEILQNFILTGGYTGTELLDRLIVTNGLVEIVTAYPYFYYPFATITIIGSLLGEKYISELAMTDVDKYIILLSESANFEKSLLALTRTELSLVLKSIDSDTLVQAFRGCSKSFIIKMRDGLDLNYFIYICKSFSSLMSLESDIAKENVLLCQNIVLCNLEKLKESGLIITTD